MEQEYPFRPRGKHGFDREDVINYIAQAQQRCNEHLARMEELEAAKNAWYTQAKGMEREKASLVARNRELEEQLERGAAPAGGDWYQADPMLASFQETQELAALRARCLELEERLEQQNIQQTAQEQAVATAQQDLADIRGEAAAAREATEAAQQEAIALRTASDGLHAQVDTLLSENAALRAQADGLLAEMKARDDELPRFSLHQQEADLLRAQLEQQAASLQAHASQVAALEQEKAMAAQQLGVLQQENYALGQKLAILENERSAFTVQMPALQEQLSRLAESAEQITTLESTKAALAAELEAARQQLDQAARQADEQAQAIAILGQELEDLRASAAMLQQERDSLVQRCAALSQAETLASQKLESLAAEAEGLGAQIAELEGQKAQNQPSEETLRSMVLASFNYSNLYVDNNLKTAQFISEATSRNIGRVSDSANSLLEQLESIARSFNDTTDGIRRNLASFQRELGSIQSGMNRRLSQDRFAALLEENERLRVRLETELLAELSSEEEDNPVPLPAGEDAALPFAEDLPKNYHEYLDD